MTKTHYTITDTTRNEVKRFDSIKKSKEFIENWGIENNHHVGKVDIDGRTLLWNVGTFKNPLIQFEKHTKSI